MKLIIMCLSVAAIAVAQAEQPPFDIRQKPVTEQEKQARKAWFEKKRLEHTGGFIAQPGTQRGQIVYVNCQDRADKKLLEASAEYFRTETKFNIVIKDGGTFEIANAKVEGNATLFVVNDPKLPPSLLASESRWAMVNVAHLICDKPAFFEARVKKALTRGFALLCGASNSQYPLCLTGPVLKAGDLDKCIDLRLQAEVIQRFQSYMQAYGVTPAHVTTYKKACQEGWAPAPTNDYQKAIWEQIKAEKEQGPTNALHIKP